MPEMLGNDKLPHIDSVKDVGEIRKTGSWAANSLTCLPKKYLI